MLEGLLDRVLIGTPPNEARIRGIDVREPDMGLWKEYVCTGCHLRCIHNTRAHAPPVWCAHTGLYVRYEEVE
jgi:hypothetical protein